MPPQEAQGIYVDYPVTAPLPPPQTGNKRGPSDDAQIEVGGRDSKEESTILKVSTIVDGDEGYINRLLTFLHRLLTEESQ